MKTTPWRAHLRTAAWDLGRLYAGRDVIYNGPDVNPAGAQCVNVPNEFRRMLGLTWWEGNASSWAGPGMDRAVWIPAEYLVEPLAGDVAVFLGSPYSEYGHTALVLDGSHAPMVTLAEQDYPIGAGVSLNSRVLDNLVGVQRLTHSSTVS
jgi:hypothetical protein